jgi:hypothetical protein
MKNTNMADGLNLKLTFCFKLTTHEPLHIGKRSFVQWKIMDIPTSFISIITFFNGPFAYGNDGIFKLLMWKTIFVRIQNTNMVGSWKLKFTFYFMERTHKLLHLYKWSFVHWKIMDIHTSFIWIIFWSFWIWRYFKILMLCWDKRWTTLCRIL